jgi:hypothetical protein
VVDRKGEDCFGKTVIGLGAPRRQGAKKAGEGICVGRRRNGEFYETRNICIELIIGGLVILMGRKRVWI